MSEFTDESDDSERSTSRRSVLRTGALAAVGAGIGGGAVASAAAQQEGGGDEVGIFGDDDNTGDESWFNQDEASTAAMYRDQWVPNGLFTISSPVIDFDPDAPGIADNFWDNYNTRIIRYIGTNEHLLFFPKQDAVIGPFEGEAGFVVDDDYVEEGGDGLDAEDEVVVGGNAIGDEGGVDENEVRQLRPTIWILSRQNQFFSGDDYVVSVEFSPIPEQEEERVWNEVEDEFSISQVD